MLTVEQSSKLEVASTYVYQAEHQHRASCADGTCSLDRNGYASLMAAVVMNSH